MSVGLCSASEVLQQRNDRTFGDIPCRGVLIADDLIIAGRDEEEHNQSLKQVLERARSKNVRLSIDKIQHKQVKYMGHLIGEDGQIPDPDKIKVIVEMPMPEDNKGFQRLSGMIKYLASFIPGEFDITAPLRELLLDGRKWRWSWQHDAALHNVKQILTSDAVLAFYDRNLLTIIQADASQTD
jgi:hypothetical protein